MKSTNPLDILIHEAFFKSGTGIKEAYNNIVDGKRVHADDHSTMLSQILPSHLLWSYSDWWSKTVDTNTVIDNAESLLLHVALSDQITSRGCGKFGSNFPSVSTSNNKAYIRDSHIVSCVFHGYWRIESYNSELE